MDQNNKTGPDSTVDLTSLDEEFAAADGQLDDVPDGKYEVVVEQVELITAKSSGAPTLRWTGRIAADPHRGRCLFKYSVLTARSLPFFKGDLKKCQVELGKLSELPGQLQRLLGLRLEVSKKKQGDFTRINILRLLSNGAGTNGNAAPGAAGNGDLPAL